MLRKIGLKLERLEEDIFEERNQEVVRDISNAKQEIINFRKIVRPQRAALSDLERTKRYVTGELDIYFDDINDASERIWDMLENFKEVIEGLEATNEAVLSHRLNDVLRVLTAFSVVMLPLTLIASVFGMNNQHPRRGLRRRLLGRDRRDGRRARRDARDLPQARLPVALRIPAMGEGLAAEGPRAHGQRAPAMHGARGLAACAVVLLHAGLYSATFLPGDRATEVWRHLDSAVPVFFALSGFLLYSPFAAAHARGHAAPRFLAYAARRALRIFPGYWLVLVATMVVFSLLDVVTPVPNSPGSVADGVSWFGLFALWGPMDDRAARAVPQSWTLDVEVAFYLVLPLVAALTGMAVRRGVPWLRAELVGLGVFAAGSMAVKLAGAAQGGTVTTEVSFIGWPLSYFDGFAIGMALAVLALWHEDGGRVPRAVRAALSARALWGAWALLLLVAVVVLRTDDPLVAQKIWDGPRFLVEYTVYIGLGALLVAPVLLGWGAGAGRVRSLLSSGPVLRLGTISYGIYLWHFFVFDLARHAGLDVTGGAGAYVLWVAVGLGGSIVLATLSWKLVEQPALALKRYVPLQAGRPAAVAGTPGTATAEPVPERV